MAFLEITVTSKKLEREQKHSFLAKKMLQPGRRGPAGAGLRVMATGLLCA